MSKDILHPIFEKEELKAISPEWLEAHGFALVTPGVQEKWEYFPAVFDVPGDPEDGDLCYLEKKLDRKQFCIVLSPNKYSTGEKYFRFEIYIQEDIGCGFVNIPNQFTEMTEYHFSLLYEAIRREKL
jgi:hypothetical protein